MIRCSAPSRYEIMAKGNIYTAGSRVIYFVCSFVLAWLLSQAGLSGPVQQVEQYNGLEVIKWFWKAGPSFTGITGTFWFASLLPLFKNLTPVKNPASGAAFLGAGVSALHAGLPALHEKSHEWEDFLDL